MARQGYAVNTSEKKLEVFSSFGGGMVTQSHPEKLRDDQLVLLENADIIAGGAVENRGAWWKSHETTLTGIVQGRFRYKDSYGGTEELVAINGYLYKARIGSSYLKLTITGLAQFQQDRRIQAVQLRDKMYFATGSGIVVYDGTTASLLTAYAPTGLEYLYIGSNGYAANPDTYLTDTTGASNTILNVSPSSRYGVINQSVTFTAYVQKISGDTLEYQFETKGESDAAYTVDQAWGTTKTFPKVFPSKGNFLVRVSLRKQGTTLVLSQYVLPRYTVNEVPDTSPEPSVSFANMSTCTKIFIHYDRLWLYGDTTNPDYLYMSHLNKFDYFPRTNIIQVNDPIRGALTKAIPFKNFLVCFTNSSIQMITGVSPQDFEKQPIHTSLGTTRGDSVQVMRNYLVFTGNDNGVYILKSFNFASTDKLNVERIDMNMKDVIEQELDASTNVLSTIYNNQYYLYIESEDMMTTRIYRFYYDLGVWVRDVLPSGLTFSSLFVSDSMLFAIGNITGNLYTLSKDFVADDGHQYVMKVITKDYNFGMPHHRKKLKQYQLIAKLGFNTNILVSLYGDDNLLTTEPVIFDYTQISDTQKLKIITNGRFRCVKAEISIVVKEDIQLIGFGFIFKENTPK